MKKRIKTRTKIRNKSKFISICMACFLFACIPVQVFAQNTGSILIKASVDREEGKTYALPGTEYRMFQVSDYENGRWQLKDGFEEADISFDFSDATKQNEEAKGLAQFARTHRIEGKDGTTNADGELLYTGLEQGIYLFEQITTTRLKSDEYQSEPFLVVVPENYAGETLWNVTVEPKFTNESIQTIPTEKTNVKKDNKKSTDQTPKIFITRVKTGDDSLTYMWLMLLGISIGIITAIADMKRKK